MTEPNTSPTEPRPDPGERRAVELLERLHSEDWYQRKEALTAITSAQLNDARVLEAVKVMADNDAVPGVRDAAKRLLAGEPIPDAPTGSPMTEPAKPSGAPKTARKLLDFGLGFGGWYIVNILAWLAVTGGRSDPFTGYANQYGIMCNLVLLPANILVMLVLLIRRPWIGAGIMATYVVNFAVSMMLQLVSNGACWIPFVIK